MFSGLDDFSQRFADALTSAFPSLAQHAKAELGTDGAKYLLIDYAPVQTRPDCTFFLTTAEGDVIIGFDKWHGHFEWPDEADDPLRFIADLLADRTLVVVTMNGDTWAGSQTVTEAEPPELPALEPGQTRYVRSWSGTKDRDAGGSAAGGQGSTGGSLRRELGPLT